MTESSKAIQKLIPEAKQKQKPKAKQGKPAPKGK
jgi:hypothetical protein